MRNLIAVCAVVCMVVLAAGFASAANPGQVPHNTLSQMGLAGLQPMSDLQGDVVRGKSFVAAGGFSVAAVPGAIDAHGSVAVGSHVAATTSGAWAGVSVLGFSVASAAANGYATAVAH